MQCDYKERLREFKDYLKEIEYLNSTINFLNWDMRVNIPPKGIEARGEVLGYLAGEVQKLQTSKMMKDFINYFTEGCNLDEITSSTVRMAKRNYEYSIKVPEERCKEYAAATLKSETVWQEAKKKSDFLLFKPYLEEQIKFKKEFIEYWGYKNHRYNTLLDLYEPGMTVEKLDVIFGELKDVIIELVNKIRYSGKNFDNGFFNQYFSVEDQKSFCRHLLSIMGYSFEAGRCDESAHPYTTIVNKNDIRLTTHYYENDFRRAAISCMHEGGHGIYAQNIPDSLKGTMLSIAPSCGLDESQSRFYENIIGRSKPFWSYMLPEVKKRFRQFDKISLDEFYKGLNKVDPTPNRLGSDELTYSLHIIIRYELEKLIIDEDIEIDELPMLWKQKYKEYLGVEPENDAEGILQDMHWGNGLIGYFPCYALGNLYDAQFLNRIKTDIPDVFERIEKGDIATAGGWLKDNVHKYGAIYEPDELMKKITGEELKAKYYIEYLKNKYTELYCL